MHVKKAECRSKSMIDYLVRKLTKAMLSLEFNEMKTDKYDRTTSQLKNLIISYFIKNIVYIILFKYCLIILNFGKKSF